MNTIHHYFLIGLLLLASVSMVSGQSLPENMVISEDGRRLSMGKAGIADLYQLDQLRTISLDFEQDNYWALLEANYEDEIEIPATLTMDGQSYENVGVRFRGNTSYAMLNGSEKTSFNIAMDYEVEGQELMGYETLNLNNAFQDFSMIREILYLQLNRAHIPSLQGNFVALEINGESWGIYPNVQQLNNDFIEEWFLSKDGSRWRCQGADAGLGGGPGGGGPGGGGPGGGGPGGGGPGGGGPGGGGQWGNGLSALNWLGTAQQEYEDNYTLKKSYQEDPWGDLMHVCDVLNNTEAEDLEEALNEVMDVDRALWFLAHEIAFTDDDGYVFKGMMDYYAYIEAETGRLTPLEYDGNSVMDPAKVNWTPFHNADNENYPLMNILFNVPQLRQRYLAHLRTLIKERMDPDFIDASISQMEELISEGIQNDPKITFSFAQWQNGVQEVRDFLSDRREVLLANAEVAAEDIDISNVQYSTDGVVFEQPNPQQSVSVTASIDGLVGAKAVNLYYSSGFVGLFSKTTMFDDGLHEDGAADDGVYGGTIPAFEAGSYVRYYIEAVADDVVGTVSYMPAGAEHDVFLYSVTPEYVESELVINEIMASNDAAIADQDGEFDDWIELYNNSAVPIDLTNWALTDDVNELQRWTFPEGSSIEGYGYLIIWADKDEEQEGLHAGFNLSSGGETLWLVNPEREIADEIIFQEQTTDLAWARNPNGIGDFVAQPHTFGMNNEQGTAVAEISAIDWSLYPNPADDWLVLQSSVQGARVAIYNMHGQQMFEALGKDQLQVNIQDWPAGIYLAQVEDSVKKVIVR